MLLALTIIINSFIAVAFKGFQKYGVNNLQGIIVNYFVCAITASFVFMKPAINASTFSASWFMYALGLSFLFIFIFNVAASSVQKLGILVTTIFQKLSLVFPSIVGILFFNEILSIPRAIGILLALSSIVLINFPKSKDLTEWENLKRWWYLALFMFFGSGLIEVTLYYVSATGLSAGSDLEFTASLFFFSGVIGLFYYLGQCFTNPFRFQMKALLWGTLLGIPNFFSIYWIMVLLESGMDGSVIFPILNVGVICLNAIIGIFFFKEQISLIRFIGLTVAIVAIILLIL